MFPLKGLGSLRLPYTSPGILCAGKHVNKSVRYRAALIKFALGSSRGSYLPSLGWMDGSLIFAPNPGALRFGYLLSSDPGVRRWDKGTCGAVAPALVWGTWSGAGVPPGSLW